MNGVAWKIRFAMLLQVTAAAVNMNSLSCYRLIVVIPGRSCMTFPRRCMSRACTGAVFALATKPGFDARSRCHVRI